MSIAEPQSTNEVSQEPEDVMSLEEIVGRLEETTSGVEIHRKKWRVGKALDGGQRERVAGTFHASTDRVRGSKTIVDRKAESFKAVERVFDDAYAFFISMTIPYPEVGVRLINNDKLSEFEQGFRRFQNRMEIAVDDLQSELPSIIEKARETMGQLFNEADYPRSLDGCYDLSFDIKQIQPPSSLAQLNPDMFREQLQRAKDRIQHSVSLLENEFLNEMQTFVGQIMNGVEPTDGRKKTVRESTVERINSFLERFDTLNLNSSGQLNHLVKMAGDAMRGREIKDLRSNETVRREIREQFGKIQQEVDQLVETRSSRKFSI